MVEVFSASDVYHRPQKQRANIIILFLKFQLISCDKAAVTDEKFIKFHD